MNMEFETLKLDVVDHLATVTLNRPDKLNSLSLQLLVDLRSAFKHIASTPDIRGLLITGAGRGFCAGADLTADKTKFNLNPDDAGETLRDYFVPAFQLLRNMNIPTVAAVNGPCAGAGMSLALTCDIVFAARSAMFMQAFVQIGLVPDTGSSWLVNEAVGPARAKALMMLGEKLPAEQAAEWGMIWKCVDDDKLMAEAGAVASKLANGPTYTYQHIKKLAHAASHNSLRDQIQLENDFQMLMRDSEDTQEARAAFLEKRKPVFKGR